MTNDYIDLSTQRMIERFQRHLTESLSQYIGQPTNEENTRRNMAYQLNRAYGEHGHWKVTADGTYYLPDQPLERVEIVMDLGPVNNNRSLKKLKEEAPFD